MVDFYGTVEVVQQLVWGDTNPDYDVRSQVALNIASDLIDSKLNNRNREDNPSSRIDSAANLIAGAILASNPENMSQHQWYKQAMVIIDQVRGNVSDDADWNYQAPIQREQIWAGSQPNTNTDSSGNTY